MSEHWTLKGHYWKGLTAELFSSFSANPTTPTAGPWPQPFLLCLASCCHTLHGQFPCAWCFEGVSSHDISGAPPPRHRTHGCVVSRAGKLDRISWFQNNGQTCQCTHIRTLVNCSGYVSSSSLILISEIESKLIGPCWHEIPPEMNIIVQHPKTQKPLLLTFAHVVGWWLGIVAAATISHRMSEKLQSSKYSS